MIDCQQTEEMLGAIADSGSMVDLNHHLVKICGNFFVDKFAISRFFGSGSQSENVEFYDTYPREWMDHYVKNQYYEHDKVVELKNTRLPFSWKIDSLLGELTPIQKRLYQEASDFGICSVFLIVCSTRSSKTANFID